MLRCQIATISLAVGMTLAGTIFSRIGYCDPWNFIEIADADRLCKSDGDCVLFSYTCNTL